MTETPSEINHLALVAKGHWDQKEGSVGFDNTKYERIEMAESVNPSGTALELNDVVEAPKPAVEAARVDTDKVSETLSRLDSVAARLEATSAKLDEKEVAMSNRVDEEIKEEVTEKTDSEETEEKVDSEEVPEELNDETEEVALVDDFGPEHHEQPSEPKVDEDTEIIDSEDVEALDAERDELLDDMRETCDSAHPSLNVKMPHITMRETPRSIISKFMTRNPQYVDAKYKSLRLDSMADELADEVYVSMKSNIAMESKKLGSKQPQRGFIDTQRGYAVDSSF